MVQELDRDEIFQRVPRLHSPSALAPAPRATPTGLASRKQVTAATRPEIAVGSPSRDTPMSRRTYEEEDASVSYDHDMHHVIPLSQYTSDPSIKKM